MCACEPLLKTSGYVSGIPGGSLCFTSSKHWRSCTNNASLSHQAFFPSLFLRTYQNPPLTYLCSVFIFKDISQKISKTSLCSSLPPIPFIYVSGICVLWWASHQPQFPCAANFILGTLIFTVFEISFSIQGLTFFFQVDLLSVHSLLLISKS